MTYHRKFYVDAITLINYELSTKADIVFNVINRLFANFIMAATLIFISGRGLAI